jgi:peptidoglycan/LPS O-acetylase OafA/YrhL
MEGLRGFSALLVFFVHFNDRCGALAADSGLRAALEFAGPFGHCGVDVFFALSGFIR